MNFEKNWTSKSLERLEKSNWGKPAYDSYLVTTCYQLRRKPLKDFEIEDLRIMIGQDISLPFLIPLAMKELQINIIAEGDFYEGDLLMNVLKSDPEYWKQEVENWKEVKAIFKRGKQKINQKLSYKIKNELFDAFVEFVKIN